MIEFTGPQRSDVAGLLLVESSQTRASAALDWLKVESISRPRLASNTEIANAGPRRVHRGLPTEALLLSDCCGGLQHFHLELGYWESTNLVLLGSSRARSADDDNSTNQDESRH
jgi:hypothetical protein